MQLVSKKHPALKAISTRVSDKEDISELVRGMRYIMLKRGGVGLAAPQVGVTKRVIVIKYASYDLAIINPVIVKTPGRIVESLAEGCLSFPGLEVTVKRHKRVIVRGLRKNRTPIKIDARGFLAFILQHEIDHLNGRTIDENSRFKNIF